MFRPEGWVTRHGFWGGNDVYFRMSMSDPVMVSALVDILACVVVALILLVTTLPRGRKYWPHWIVMLVATFFYPGFGLLLFLALHWRRLRQLRPAD